MDLQETSDGRFPPTHASLIAMASDRSDARFREAWERFFREYWPPLYTFLRRTGSAREEALDVLQDFFVEGLEGDLLPRYDPSRGRFRTYLLACLRHKRSGHQRKEARGGRVALDLAVCAELDRRLQTSPEEEPERGFQMDWARQILAQAIGALSARLTRSEDAMSLRVLREWVVAARRPEAAALAGELGISAGDLYTRGTRLREALLAEVDSQVRRVNPAQADPREERDEILGILQGHAG